MDIRDMFLQVLDELADEVSYGVEYCDMCCDYVQLNQFGEMMCPHGAGDYVHMMTDDVDELDFGEGDE